MPAILDRVVRQIQAQGKSKAAAFAIGTRALQRAGDLKPGSTQATSKGIMRGKMTPAARSNDRASKRSGRPTSAYTYNARSNSSKLRRGR